MSSSKIKGLLDARYGLRPQRLHATITAAPLLAGRSAGYVIATVGGVGGVRVNVSPDLRSPLTVGDTIVVEGSGTPAAMEYWAGGRIAGARADSDVYQFPEGGVAGGTTFQAGDILLGSIVTDRSNWWYQYELGRWQIRKGDVGTGAIGDLNGLYGYNVSTYGTAFGQYSVGQINITTDPVNGFRIRNYATPVFQADTSGNMMVLTSLSWAAGMGRADTTGISVTANTSPTAASDRAYAINTALGTTVGQFWAATWTTGGDDYAMTGIDGPSIADRDYQSMQFSQSCPNGKTAEVLLRASQANNLGAASITVLDTVGVGSISFEADAHTFFGGNITVNDGIYLTPDMVGSDFTVPAGHTAVYCNMTVPPTVTVIVEGTLLDNALP